MVLSICKECKESKVKQGEVQGVKGEDEYLAIYERWEADPSPANDVAWVKRLAYVAINAGLPIYEDGVEDAGPDGWSRLVRRYEGGEKRENETRNTEYKVPPLPWAAVAG